MAWRGLWSGQARSMSRRSLGTARGQIIPPQAKTRYRWTGRRMYVLGTAMVSTATIGMATSVQLDKSTNEYQILDRLDAVASLSDTSHLSHLPLSLLFRAYLVYAVCSQPVLVDMAPSVIHTFEVLKTALPLGIGDAICKGYLLVMRKTFFAQFVGGESAEDCRSTIADLHRRSCSTMLNWSAEAEDFGNHTDREHTAILPEGFTELTRAVEMASSLQSRQGPKSTMVAVKVTGLVNNSMVFSRASQALESSTSYARGQADSTDIVPQSPALYDDDIPVLLRIYQELQDLCNLAQLHGVRLAFDAEQSWLQPALDRMVNMLAAEFNKGQIPIVYNTYQASLRGCEDALRNDLSLATSKGYALGVKLVRGAYVDAENSRAKKTASGTSKAWSSRIETDTCYNKCADLVLDCVLDSIRQGKTGPSLMLATHNLTSIKSSIQRLIREGFLEVDNDHLNVDDKLRGRLIYAQLFGMADKLTSVMMSFFPNLDNTSDTIPMNCLYLPYGRIDQVLPYLVRRAQENRSMLEGVAGQPESGAKAQLRAISSEISKRLLGH